MKEKIEEVLKIITKKEVSVLKAKEENGDYATNIAFVLAREQGDSPEVVANNLKKEVEKSYGEFFSKIEVKNGFLNFFVADNFLREDVEKIIKEDYSYGKEGLEKKVLIDYSSPNVAKSFGVGHLRSTIIGQSLYNIYQFLGWRAVGVNHLGDWGTQYGKLIYQIKKEKKDPEKLSIKELEELYVRFHKQAEEDESAVEEGRRWFSLLEKGDKEAKRVWKICRDKSLEEFNKIYQELEVDIDYVLGESFYESKLEDVIKEAKERGVAKESEGALIVEFDDMPPAMIQKTDKSTTYFTRDLAAVKYRLKEFSPDLFLYEIGADQTLHMKQLFTATEMMGWAKKSSFVHIAHGMFRLEEGKFSTRKGRTVHLEDVLTLAKKKAKEIIDNSNTTGELELEEKEHIARIVGVGAVKYNDLKRHYKRDVVFDWDRVVTLRGDSGPYLQYTCVRCKSIIDKCDSSFSLKEGELNDKERRVVKRLAQFKETVELAGETFSPNVIADYAHSLSKEFNAFYDENTILGDQKREGMTKATYIILKQSLHLLTISVPEKM